MKVFIIQTDNGDTLGVAINEKIAIREMVDYLEWHAKNSNWFDTEEELEEVIADVKLNLQADGYIYAYEMELWDE